MRKDIRGTEQIAEVDRQHAIELVRFELTVFLELTRSLDPEDWERPIDHLDWTVRDVLAHVTGQFQELANIVTFLTRLLTLTRTTSCRKILPRASDTGRVADRGEFEGAGLAAAVGGGVGDVHRGDVGPGQPGQLPVQLGTVGFDDEHLLLRRQVLGPARPERE